MAQFHEPNIQPFNPFRKIGPPNLQSRYIPNQYYIDFTPAWWRAAIDNAINYSDLTYLDTLYSWCVQSSPFLVSQINKRLIPIEKRTFLIANKDGVVNEALTKSITNTKWFRKLIRAILLSRFYGVKVVGIDVKNDELIDFPMRNIDIVNKAIRSQTYDVENVAELNRIDNFFFIQPDDSQDFKLGMLQPISRAMIGIVEAYNNWSAVSALYSYPRTTIGYLEGNEEIKTQAENLAVNFDPFAIPLIPFRQSLDDKTNVYQMEVKPQQTQMYPDAFRVYKEFIESYRAEVMQLVTGGTLLGATEKNTNSEQIASIHMSLYEDLLRSDVRLVLEFFNFNDTFIKLATLLGIEDLKGAQLIEAPDKTITIDTFERVGKILASQGMAYSPNILEKIGMEATDIDDNARNNNWGNKHLQDESLWTKIKSLF